MKRLFITTDRLEKYFMDGKFHEDFSNAKNTKYQLVLCIPFMDDNLSLEYIQEVCKRFEITYPINTYEFIVTYIKDNQPIYSEHMKKLRDLNQQCIDSGLGIVYLTDDKFLLDRFYPVEQVISANQKLNNVCEFIKNATKADKNGKVVPLSIFEKYMLAYDYVTQYVYKDEDPELGEIPSASRTLVPILTGDKIVCVGFVEMLKQICDRVFDPSELLLMPTGVELVNPEAKENDEHHDHQLAHLYINDPKSKIHGVFLNDITTNARGMKKNRDMSFMAVQVSDYYYIKGFLSIYDSDSLMHQYLVRNDKYYMEDCKRYAEIFPKYKKWYGDLYKNDYSSSNMRLMRRVTGITDPKIDPEPMFKKIVECSPIPLETLIESMQTVGQVYERAGFIKSAEEFAKETFNWTVKVSNYLFLGADNAISQAIKKKKIKRVPPQFGKQPVIRTYIENLNPQINENPVDVADLLDRITTFRSKKGTNNSKIKQDIQNKFNIVTGRSDKVNQNNNAKFDLEFAIVDDVALDMLMQIHASGEYLCNSKIVKLSKQERVTLFKKIVRVTDARREHETMAYQEINQNIDWEP